MSVALMVMMVLGCILTFHWIVYIKYMQLFTYNYLFSKVVYWRVWTGSWPGAKVWSRYEELRFDLGVFRNYLIEDGSDLGRKRKRERGRNTHNLFTILKLKLVIMNILPFLRTGVSLSVKERKFPFRIR